MKAVVFLLLKCSMMQQSKRKREEKKKEVEFQCCLEKTQNAGTPFTPSTNPNALV